MKIIYIIIQSLKIEINIFIDDKHIYMFFMWCKERYVYFMSEKVNNVVII